MVYAHGNGDGFIKCFPLQIPFMNETIVAADIISLGFKFESDSIEKKLISLHFWVKNNLKIVKQ